VEGRGKDQCRPVRGKAMRQKRNLNCAQLLYYIAQDAAMHAWPPLAERKALAEESMEEIDAKR
jgi:hypothetical protein